jgi:hypothetical protein
MREAPVARLASNISRRERLEGQAPASQASLAIRLEEGMAVTSVTRKRLRMS